MYSVEIQSGCLNPARLVLSPNCDQRPEGARPELIVIHSISLPPSEYGSDAVIDLFLNQLDPLAHPYFEQVYSNRVSAHLFIRRDGEVVQFVPFHQRAWHAGVSFYQGRDKCNDFSIGIELEGSVEEPFEEAQYQSLVPILDILLQTYGIKPDAIVGHQDIAPGRKDDPGPYFDWSRLGINR